MDIQTLQKSLTGLFPETLGIRFTAVSESELRAELEVRRDLCTLPGVLHGGAIMAFADTLGAYGTAINLPPGASTTTIESKTNFFSRGIEGKKVIGICQRLHGGRSTMVWQTRVERDDGQLVALVTQTQIVLPAKLEPPAQLAALFADQPVAAQQQLLASLERSGAGLYRAWAEAEERDEVRGALMQAAEREEVNAQLLEELVEGLEG